MQSLRVAASVTLPVAVHAIAAPPPICPSLDLYGLLTVTLCQQQLNMSFDVLSISQFSVSPSVKFNNRHHLYTFVVNTGPGAECIQSKTAYD